jgi:predicted dehydrogenase
MKWIVAGVGDIARKRVIPAIQSDERNTLHGLVRRNAKEHEAFSDLKVWASVEEAVRDEAVDAVYIALPVAAHADAAIAALRAGKHVVCEKPMAMNVAEGARMVAAATKSRALFAVAYYRRTYPKLIRARQLIAEGAIGVPLLAEANFHRGLPPDERSWLWDPALAGGGPLYDVASHRLDAMNFLFGKPVGACGLMSNAIHKLKVEDSATALVRFQNGIHGVVDVRWNSQVPRDQFRVIGTDGELNLDPLDGPTLLVNGREEILPAEANVHLPLLRNFVDSIEQKAPEALVCSAEEALWVDWTIEQVVLSQTDRSRGDR